MGFLANANSGVLAPPTDMQPNMTVAWIYVAFTGVGLLVALVLAVDDARRTRSPLFALLLFSGLTIFPFAIEPTYDIIMATWYPPELPVQLVTILGRPMALMVPLMYASSVSLTCYVTYRMIVAGVSVRAMVLFLAGLSVIEGIGEMVASHFDIMRYYGNLATIFDVPVPTLVQNAGMFSIIGVALAMIVPHLSGWRWLIIPFVPPMLYIGYVVSCTLPNFLAIHGQAGPALFWVLAAISTFLNGLVAVAALYMPIAKQYREDAALRKSSPARVDQPAVPADA